MKMFKSNLVHIAIGATLMGVGATVGLVINQVNQPIVAQAAIKTKKVKISDFIWKDGKWHDFKANLPYGKTTAIKRIKYKGYQDVGGGSLKAITVSKNGSVEYGGAPYYFMKVISSKQQAKNAKSKHAVTVNGAIFYYTKSKSYQKMVKYTARGLVGTMVKIKAPKVAGYKYKQKTINVGIGNDHTGIQWKVYHYVKK